MPVEPAALREGPLVLPSGDDRHRYLATVLRLQEGDTLELFDGTGRRARATVATSDRRALTLAVGPPEPAPPIEARAALTLLFGVPRGDGADRIVRAATEIGVAALCPVLTTRSTARPPPARAQRWQRIAREGARQCGRSVVPEVAPPTPLPEALAALPPSVTLRLVPWEDEEAVTLTAAMASAQPATAAAAVLVGPEGGLTADEVESCRAAGFTAVTLGPRILRAPTAALVASALVLHRLGDLG